MYSLLINGIYPIILAKLENHFKLPPIFILKLESVLFLQHALFSIPYVIPFIQPLSFSLTGKCHGFSLKPLQTILYFGSSQSWLQNNIIRGILKKNVYVYVYAHVFSGCISERINTPKSYF